MNFNCPECSTPHQYPEDQIPETGLVVACTRCAAHITITRRGVQSAQPQTPAPEPPAATADHHLAATSAAQAALDVGPKTADLDVAPAPEPEPKPRVQPKPRIQAKPRVQPQAPSAAAGPSTGGAEDRASGLFGAAMSGIAGAARSAADAGAKAFDEMASERMSGEVEVPAGLAFPSAAAQGDWTWKDLPRAFMGVMDLRRVGMATAGFWAALVAFGAVQWLGAFLGGKVWGPLGSVLDIAAWVVFVLAAGFVAAVMGYVVHRTVVDQQPASAKEGIEWTKARVKSVLGTPLAFAGVILAVGVVYALVGLLGRVPWAGPIVWGVVSPALFALALFAGLVAVALLYCLPLYVPVVLNEQTGPVETLKRLLSLFRTYGSQLLAYVLGSIVMIGFAFTVTVLPALVAGMRLMGQVSGQAMGGNYLATLGSMPAAFVSPTSVLVLSRSGGFAEQNFGHTLGGIFAGLGNLIPLAILMALLGLAYYTAGAIIYAIVTGRKRR